MQVLQLSLPVQADGVLSYIAGTMGRGGLSAGVRVSGNSEGAFLD